MARRSAPRRHHGLLRRRHGHDGGRDGPRRGEPARLRAPIYGGGTDGATAPDDAPPLFILCAADDRLAAAGSVRLYSEWKAAGRPVELHIYEKGGHGVGLGRGELAFNSWPQRCEAWLGARGILKAGGSK